MMIRALPAWLISCSLFMGACQRPSDEVRGRVAEPYLPDAGSVGFDIEPLSNSNGSSQWLATYTSQGKTAKFRIKLGPSQVSKAKNSKDFDIETGDGSLIAESASDSSVLLVELKKALQAKVLPAKVQKASSLSFTFVIFGKNQSQVSDGGFVANPPGNWTAMKIFIVEGEQEGEVFLNLNPQIKKGQFSIKDVDYGDFVVAQLAKVL